MSERSWRSPGRVNLIGEHTDYNDGFCLPLAIAQGCVATVSVLDDPVVEVASAQQSEPVELALDVVGSRRSVGGRFVGRLRGRRGLGAARAGPLDSTGCPSRSTAMCPLGAGLSSSAALECSVAGAVNDLF